ncbi:hypothetical protein E3N88_09411 [Mikania micrantha]|uniref:Uncharacterized protein n=1 Tax=Mikania micrantha TaxID=192012 RepID=A0A5N6PM20_9ASTR|nr:hypothetical protein E3N88_09411 [Mikania micrantha]
MFSMEKDMDDFYEFHRSHELIWPLNASLFLNFKELRRLDLSLNFIGNTFMSSGLEKLSELKKLENLNLGYNFIETNIFPSLSELNSLKILNLTHVNGYNMKPTHDISEFRISENLEVLDLTENGCYGTLQMQGSQETSKFRLKSLNLALNHFNESLITVLTTFTSLKTLNLLSNSLSGPFPSQEISELTNLEMLDLSYNSLNVTPSIQDCKSLMRLERLESVSLAHNYFNKSIISCLSFLPSLNILDLSYSYNLGKVPNLPYLEVLILRHNNLNGTLPMEGFCDLKNLQELDLSDNMFDGNLPKCFSGLLSLKFFDISSNQFTGIVPPSLIVNLTSLEYVDFSYNKFEGSFLFSLFSNHTKIQFFLFESGSEKIEVETEEPIGWIPMFQLKFLVLSNCIKKRPKGSVVPSFLLHQHKLRVLDLSCNSLKGQFLNWLLKNNKNLEILKLKDNIFRGVIHMRYKSIMKYLDMSGNHITGAIPENLQSFIPDIRHLNFSSNELNGVIPTSMLDLTELLTLDLSNNKLSGEVPKGLFTNLSSAIIIKLSNNTLYGNVLSGNLSLGSLEILQLDNNCFTGNIGINTSEGPSILDISENHFTGRIPSWMCSPCDMWSSPLMYCVLVARNNRLDGPFPCGDTSFDFLDISQNSFSGPIPTFIYMKNTRHLHLGSNRFTGLVPVAFQNLTSVLSLDISQNYLSGRIPEFLGELSSLRILLLGRNNFIGSIQEKLCQLNNVSLIDLSSNFLTGLIPRCLNNITGPKQLAFTQKYLFSDDVVSLWDDHISQYHIHDTSLVDPMESDQFETRDEIQFTTKNNPLTYKGNILDYMWGLDLSSNKLTGEIPEELGMLTHILALNLSHNKLSGPIPISFSNLSLIESLDLSSNSLSGKVPSELIQLTKLAVFNVSYNNLSGRLPERKAQFGTFGKESYEGNPLLCGTPLENNCMTTPQVSEPSTKKDTEKWYDIDKASFYGSSCSTWFVFMLGFVAILYINPYWHRRWLEFVEECMYTCCYFLYDFVRSLAFWAFSSSILVLAISAQKLTYITFCLELGDVGSAGTSSPKRKKSKGKKKRSSEGVGTSVPKRIRFSKRKAAAQEGSHMKKMLEVDSSLSEEETESDLKVAPEDMAADDVPQMDVPGGGSVDTTGLESSYANAPFAPSWDILNKDRFEDPAVTLKLAKEFATPGQQLANGSLSDEEMRGRMAALWAQIGALLQKINQRWVSSSEIQDKNRTKMSILNNKLSQLQRDFQAMEKDREDEKIHALEVERFHEFLVPLAAVQNAAREYGTTIGLKSGYKHAAAGHPLEGLANYKPHAKACLHEAIATFEGTNFPYLEAVAKCVNEPRKTLQGLLPENFEMVEPLTIAGQASPSTTSFATPVNDSLAAKPPVNPVGSRGASVESSKAPTPEGN